MHFALFCRYLPALLLALARGKNPLGPFLDVHIQNVDDGHSRDVPYAGKQLLCRSLLLQMKRDNSKSCSRMTILCEVPRPWRCSPSERNELQLSLASPLQ